ncbi:MAG: Fic family protein [Bacteroidales bacterium]
MHKVKDVRVRGVSELMTEVRQSYKKPLSERLIKDWHRILFVNNSFVNGGAYRLGVEPMLIVSGSYGKEIVHYEAPPSDTVDREMEQFVCWYSDFTTNPKDIRSSFIKTSIAHLYFESIHPFEDGNGRIGRAIAEKCLADSLGQPLVMSLSSTIENKKADYYENLKKAQQTLELTEWIYYFSCVILESQRQAKGDVMFVLKQAKFIDKFKLLLNERQTKVILRMLECGADGFEEGMTAKKYSFITRSSKATATRDLQDLVEKQALVSVGLGRGAHYELTL